MDCESLNENVCTLQASRSGEFCVIVENSRTMRTLATLEDVAQRAGTSIATAGRALGGYGKVAPATRDRVVAAARQLNYHPNALARSMKQRSTFTIGLIIGNICNSFFARIVRAVETAVTRYGCKVIVCDTDESIENELDHARTLLEHRVDGIIVSPTASETGDLSRATKEIYGCRMPTVFIDRAVKGAKIPTVVSDNVAAAHDATTHFIRLGHKRIGLVVGRRALDSMTGRIEGYRRAMLEHQITFDESLVVDAVDVGVVAGYHATKKLIERNPRPTALIVMNNLLVIGALNAINEKGLIIPGDLALIGWDDFDAAPHLQKPLTVVEQPADAMGSIAAEQLMKMRSEEAVDSYLHIVLKSTLIIRESSEKRISRRS
jgi:DNA-binding LacI/PurR family transcriptional regulator